MFKNLDYFFILSIGHLILPTLQYSKVAGIGSILQQTNPNSNSKFATVRHYPFHYSHTELSNPLHSSGSVKTQMTQDDPQQQQHEESKMNISGLNSFNVAQHQFGMTYTNEEEDESSVPLKIARAASNSVKPKTEDKPQQQQLQQLQKDSQQENAEANALRVLGEGLSERFVNFVEARISPRFLKPWRSAVAATRQLFQKWEEGRGSEKGRQDGGSSLSDMLDYGWDQVSKLRESYQNLWPPSGELSHRHEGWGHQASYGESGESGLDTFALLAALAFAAYLLQLLMTLTSTTFRSLDRSMDWLPTSLLTSEFDLPNSVKNSPEATGTGKSGRIKRDTGMNTIGSSGDVTKKDGGVKLVNGKELDCEAMKKQLKWTGRVEFIVKNTKCPPSN